MDDLDARARLKVRLGGVIAAVVAALAVLVAGGALRTPLFDLFQRIAPQAAKAWRGVSWAFRPNPLRRLQSDV